MLQPYYRPNEKLINGVCFVLGLSLITYVTVLLQPVTFAYPIVYGCAALCMAGWSIGWLFASCSAVLFAVFSSWQYIAGLIGVIGLCLLAAWSMERLIGSKCERRNSGKWFSKGLTFSVLCVIGGYLLGVAG